ncbi:MAG: cell division protein FtsQ, partial [Streptococcus salivarius]
TKATSDLLTIELYDGNSIRVPLSQLTVKLPYYEKIKSQLSDGSIVDMEVGLYTTTPEVESSKTDGDKKKDKDKTDKKEENATSEEGQDTTTSMEQHSEEESNSENPGIQGQENPTVGQETTLRTSPAQG